MFQTLLQHNYLSHVVTLRETSAISRCRPDFLAWVNGVLVFWGEENSTQGGSAVETKARADLEAKFHYIGPSYFGEIKFMICYAVDGSMIRFFVADGSPEAAKRPYRMTPLTHYLDLNIVVHRLKAIKTVVNILRILLTVQDL